MSKAFTFGMTAFVLVLAGIANAYPTLTGPTGLMIVPTADIPCTGVEVAGDWQGMDNEGASIPTRALISLGRVVEIGGSYDFFNSHAPLSSAWGANAKIALFDCFDGKTAIGAQFRRELDLGDQVTDYTQGYFAWTTECSGEDIDVSNFALTVGVNWTEVSPDIAATSSYGVRFFTGLSVNLMPDVDLMGEYQTKNVSLGDTDAATSVGMRFRLDDNINAEFGYTNMLGLSVEPTHHFFAGLDFALSVPGDSSPCAPGPCASSPCDPLPAGL